MRLHQNLLFFVALAGCVFAQNIQPVADRLATQNALFEEQYESDLRNLPERATAFGDYRYNDKLAEYSLAAIVQRHQTDQAFLARLEAIPTAGFSDQDQLSHDLLVRVLKQRIADFDLKEYEMPVNQQNGIHTGLADLPTVRPARLGQALRGLHRPSSPDPSRSQPDHRSPSRRHERQADARAVSSGEAPRPVPGHHRRRSLSPCRRRNIRPASPPKTRSA